jgi:hypothetical protein
MQSALLLRLKLLRWATGLGHDTSVKPQSIVRGAAREHHAAGAGIEKVAGFLGIHNNLGSAERQIFPQRTVSL